MNPSLLSELKECLGGVVADIESETGLDIHVAEVEVDGWRTGNRACPAACLHLET